MNVFQTNSSVRMLLFVVLSIFLYAGMVQAAHAATYYVDADINDSNSSSGTPDCTTYNPNTGSCSGGSASAYASVVDINAGSFSPGDNILFQRGDSWREQLDLPSSGTANNPITYGAFGSGENPTIIGSLQNNGTGWSGPDANGEYSRAFPIQPWWIMQDDYVMQWGTRGSLGTGEWIYENGQVYIGDNPAGTIFEVGQRMGINTNHQDYVVIENFNVRYFQADNLLGAAIGGGIYTSHLSDNVLVQNNDIRYGAAYGVCIRGTTNVTIHNNIMTQIDSQQGGQSGDGILISRHRPTRKQAQFVTISHNTIGTGPDSIDRQGIAPVMAEDFEIFGNLIQGGHIGIDMEPIVDNKWARNAKIYNNYINKRPNTRDNTNNVGIAASGASSQNVKIYNNVVDLNNAAVSIGIGVRDFGGDGSAIYGNIVRNVQRGIDIGSNFVPTPKWLVYQNHVTGNNLNNSRGIRISRQDVTDVEVYYNLVSGFDDGFEIEGGVVTGSIFNNTFEDYTFGLLLGGAAHDLTVRNNIFGDSNPTRHIQSDTNTIDIDNNIYADDTGFDWRWNGTNLNGFAAWQAASGATNDFVDDPEFVNANNGNYSLANSSPAVNAGVVDTVTGENIHASNSQGDLEGNPISGLPDLGAIELGSSSDTPAGTFLSDYGYDPSVGSGSTSGGGSSSSSSSGGGSSTSSGGGSSSSSTSGGGSSTSSSGGGSTSSGGSSSGTGNPGGTPGGSDLPRLSNGCYHAYHSGRAAPNGFGTPINYFSTTQELLVRANCLASTPIMVAGSNQSNQYIYENGYAYHNGSWQPVTMSGANVAGSWVRERAVGTLPYSSTDLDDWQYVVAYVCVYANNRWNCGCEDQTCAQGRWQLQTIQK